MGALEETWPIRSSPFNGLQQSAYDELLELGYPGNSVTAHARRAVLRRIIANERAQLPTVARDIKRLAVIKRVRDVIPEDYLPASRKKTTTFILRCTWAYCNYSCTRPDRLKTHVFTHIDFRPFPCDKSCGDPHWLAHFN